MSVKIIKGWDGSLEIGRNDSGYYSFDEILYFFNIGPAKLKFYLEEYKDIIVPIYNNNNDNDILNSRYHWLEVKELNRIITKKHKNERYWEKILIHSDNSTDKYQECDAMQARISELEAELAACREQLDEARRDMSGNEKELTPKAKKSYLAVIAGLCRKSRPLDLSSRDAVSILKTEIEGDGLKLGDDTIRKIINEVRELERETPK